MGTLLVLVTASLVFASADVCDKKLAEIASRDLDRHLPEAKKKRTRAQVKKIKSYDPEPALKKAFKSCKLDEATGRARYDELVAVERARRRDMRYKANLGELGQMFQQTQGMRDDQEKRAAEARRVLEEIEKRRKAEAEASPEE